LEYRLPASSLQVKAMHPLQTYKTLRLGALLLVVLVDLACRAASETQVGGKSPGALILPSGTATN
jgi:hypothetical protein